MSTLETLLSEAKSSSGLLLVLTGAGISAESGIPTFRGAQGYWQVGSRNYQPEELATHAAFEEMPEEVWAWYLYRRGVCRAAEPNVAHRALVALEQHFADRFLLITQNVDGLHRRAGQSDPRTLAIHGDIDRMRCSAECSAETSPLPAGIDVDWAKGRALRAEEVELLRCSRCGARTRPHVLWFDESYDEPRYRFNSALQAGQRAALLWVIGTSGATNLPNQLVQGAARRGTTLLVTNADPSPFSAVAESHPRGLFLQGSAAAEVPRLVEQLTRA